METAVRSRAVVQPCGRIEVTNDQLPVGEEVDVIVFIDNGAKMKRHAIDIIREAPGQRLFKNAEEVDAYIDEERKSWDR